MGSNIWYHQLTCLFSFAYVLLSYVFFNYKQSNELTYFMYIVNNQRFVFT
jgi:hypothetical protein